MFSLQSHELRSMLAATTSESKPKGHGSYVRTPVTDRAHDMVHYRPYIESHVLSYYGSIFLLLAVAHMEILE